MPVNLLFNVVAWLATHLVLLSLLGFLVAGVLMFGVDQAPGAGEGQRAGPASGADPMPAKQALPASVSRTADQPPPVAQRTQASTIPPVAKEGGGMFRQAGERDGQLPRLIGGSLPIDDRSPYAPTTGGPAASSVDGSFRPPGELDAAKPVAMTRDEFLQQARRAFWNGEFEKAEATYMAIVSEYPMDADAFGELGNLYQSMGRLDLALDAYFAAAVRLKAAGKTDKLQEIIELLTRKGDARVDQLIP